MKKTARYVLPAIFLMILPVIVFAEEINLPKTGQTTCYDNSGNIIDCVGTGQDGDIQAGVEWPSQRFTDNGDGTVTDNLTGLMWLKDANCFGPLTWQAALDVVAHLNTSPLDYNCSDHTANYDDWRLPNVVELESLVNAEKSNSATWLNTQGIDNVQSSNYWSATNYTYGGSSNNAWIVNMSFGNVGYADKSATYIDNYVWPVRDISVQTQPAQTWQTGQTDSLAAGDDGDLQRGVGWPTPRFEDNGDGTITDHLTGLIWLKNANCLGGEIWSQALADCNNLASESCGLSDGSIAGDWRLPNRKELSSLIDYSQYLPALPQGHLFDNVQSGSYHSATTDASFSNRQWVVLMNWGFLRNGQKSSFDSVWPVRVGLGDLDILYPNGGEELSAGETFEITWASEGDIESVKIEYSVNNGADWTEIVASTENDGAYDWEVPYNPSDECLVRMSDVDRPNSEASDESDAVFTIIPPICQADFNDDGKVDDIDLYIFSLTMGDIDCTWWPALCICDTEGDDNDIDGADLAVLVAEFGRDDCP